jgi:hypothetical protein
MLILEIEEILDELERLGICSTNERTDILKEFLDYQSGEA